MSVASELLSAHCLPYFWHQLVAAWMDNEADTGLWSWQGMGQMTWKLTWRNLIKYYVLFEVWFECWLKIDEVNKKGDINFKSSVFRDT